MEKVKFELMTEYFPADVDKLKALVESGDRDEISKKAQELIDKHWPGPLGLVLPVKNNALSEYCLQDGFAAIRVPDNIISRTISRELHAPIVATSANASGKGPCYSINDVVDSLESSADSVEYGIDAGVLSNGAISTIAKICDNKVEVLREGVISEL